MCPHTPPCPDAKALDREAARTVVSHPEQGWSLLCNGIVVFEDTGELLPGGDTIAPHRPTDVRMPPPLSRLSSPGAGSAASVAPALPAA
jgi:hypothetical protein